MAWENSDRAARLPHDWQRRRIRVLRRDGYRCQARLADGRLCAHPAKDVDHIRPGDDHAEANLQSLCRWHHDKKTAAERPLSSGAYRSPRREPERHPGALTP